MNATTPKVLSIISTVVLLAAAGCDKSQHEAPPAQATAQGTARTAASTGTQTPPANAAPAESANADRYDVRSPKESVEVGKKAKIELAITPGDDLKINKEFPWKLEFSDHANVQLAQKTITDSQIELDDAEAIIPVMLEAGSPGVHTLKATADFSVCNDTKCYSIRQEQVRFEVAAQEKAGESAQPKSAEPTKSAEPN